MSKDVHAISRVRNCRNRRSGTWTWRSHLLRRWRRDRAEKDDPDVGQMRLHSSPACAREGTTCYVIFYRLPYRQKGTMKGSRRKVTNVGPADGVNAGIVRRSRSRRHAACRYYWGGKQVPWMREGEGLQPPTFQPLIATDDLGACGPSRGVGEQGLMALKKLLPYYVRAPLRQICRNFPCSMCTRRDRSGTLKLRSPGAECFSRTTAVGDVSKLCLFPRLGKSLMISVDNGIELM